jgi:hypothetical protein
VAERAIAPFAEPTGTRAVGDPRDDDVPDEPIDEPVDEPTDNQ